MGLEKEGVHLPMAFVDAAGDTFAYGDDAFFEVVIGRCGFRGIETGGG